MSELSVEKISNKTGTGPTDFADGLTVDGVTLESNYGFVPMTLIESNGTPSDSSSNRGNLWWNDSDGTLAIYNNNAWLGISGEVTAAGSAGPNDEWYGDRGIFAGGYQGSGNPKDRIEYLTISTTGNASDFGDLVAESQAHGALTGDVSTRAVFAGGNTGAAGNTMQYITTTTTGNTTDFGDLITASYQNCGFSSGTRGVFHLGISSTITPASYLNNLEYITVAITGNATDFGDASASVSRNSAGGDGAVGLVFGGWNGSTYLNTIDKYTIASPGNATDFGDLTQAKEFTAACSNQTYAIIGGGHTASAYINVLDYVTIATPGNATDFGDLVSIGSQFAATANGTRGVFGPRFTGAAFTRAVDYITIASPGNAADFGDLLGSAYYDNAACSGDAS